MSVILYLISTAMGEGWTAQYVSYTIWLYGYQPQNRFHWSCQECQNNRWGNDSAFGYNVKLQIHKTVSLYLGMSSVSKNKYMRMTIVSQILT